VICQARGEEVPPMSFSFDSSGFRRNLEETVNAGMQNLARQFQQRVDRVQGLRAADLRRLANSVATGVAFGVQNHLGARMPNFAAQ